LPEEETQRRTIGHSHVMAPELRDPAKAKYVARRLTLKATSRLRRMGYYASALSFSARLENGLRLEESERCWRAQDSLTFLRLLDKAWARAMRKAKGVRIKKVGVTLHGLVLAADLEAELFHDHGGQDMQERVKAEKLSRALDTLNHRFGRDTVVIGMLPSQGRSFSGSKIAFTRIPDKEEFLE
jgi:DNA polymerase-4